MKQLIKHFWKENLLMIVILLGNALALTATSLMQILILDALISLNLINFFAGDGLFIVGLFDNARNDLLKNKISEQINSAANNLSKG